MPRVSGSDQYRRNKILRSIWLDARRLFATLRPKDQWELHKFYMPSVEMTTEEFRGHTAFATEQDRSLPSRAGALFAKAMRILDHEQSQQPTSGDRIRVEGIVKPSFQQADIERIIRVVITVASSPQKHG